MAMSDLETRLRDTLSERARSAPDTVGLAAGARRRLRRRRTTWAVGVAAVVAAAVPIGLTQLAPSSDGGGRVADDPTVTSGLPPGVVETGYRAESWHDVTFEVPVEWGYGGVSGWCAGGGDLTIAAEVVGRPDTVVPAVACTPASGYGVTVGSSASFGAAVKSGSVWQYDADGADRAMYPDGAWLGVWYDAEVVVMVTARDRATARHLVVSVESFSGRDPNGCPATLGEAEAALSTEPDDSFSICRYDPDDLLAASRRFVGIEAREPERTIFSSPRRTVDYDCPAEADLSHTALLSGGAYLATAVTGADCPGWNGLFLSGVVQDLTPEAERHLDLSQLPVGQ